jgi:hypothetical protein
MPNIAFAEVMDKEPSLLFVWAMAVFPSLVAYWVGRRSPLLLLLVLPLPLLFYIGQLSELTDPFVGPAMWQEAGLLYGVSSWVAPMLFIVAAGLGFRLWYAHKSINS